MRDLVQLALPSKTMNARAERATPRGGERSFSEALQLKQGKSGAASGKEPPANAPTPPASAFLVRIDSHGLPTSLPLAAALRSELLQGVAAGDAIDEPAIDADELESLTEEIPSGEKTPDVVLPEIALPVANAHEAEAISGGEPELPEDAPAQAPAPTKGKDVAASAVAPALRLEPGSRSARTPADGAGEPDSTEASPASHTAAAETAKAAGRSGLAPPPANAKASPPAVDGVVRQPAAPAAATSGIAAAETKAQPAVDPERAAPSRGTVPTPAGESRSEAPRIPASVRVVEAQSFPAPPQISPPAASVTNAIAAAPDWMSLVRNPETAALTSSPGAAPIKSLTIQLNPAELGAVTAKLRFAGEQLTIELQVERVEAYDRLSTDSETMLKAVRALGIEVDKITIQQPQAPNAASARSDNGSAFNGGREAGFSAPGGSGGREGGGPNNPRGGTGREEASGQHPSGGHGSQNPDGRGLYI